MAKQRINDSAKKVVIKKKLLKYLKLALFIIFILLVNAYIILSYMFNNNSFTIYFDNEYSSRRNLVMYENSETKRHRNYLKSEDFKEFSDIALEWLPENINQEAEGSHNGNNYIAYTFYLENQGHETTNYNAEIKIQDCIKNIDEALRVVVYRNNQRTVYAKTSRETGNPEEGTVAFKDENTIMSEKISGLGVGEVDKYTIVIFVEGNDKECNDALIGGEIELYMNIKEEVPPEQPIPTQYEDENEDDI